VSLSDKGSDLFVLGLVKVGDKVKFIATKLDGALVVTGLQVSRQTKERYSGLPHPKAPFAQVDSQLHHSGRLRILSWARISTWRHERPSYRRWSPTSWTLLENWAHRIFSLRAEIEIRVTCTGPVFTVRLRM